MRNLLLLVVSTLLAIVLSEILLRVVLPSPLHMKFPQEYYLYDSDVGHRLKPEQHAYTHDKPVSVNSRGLRDREFTPVPPEGVYRILAMGDSQTFGNGLDIEDTWPKLLEKDLNARGDGVYEVINAGIPASDTWQHEIILERVLGQYQVNSVVLAFYVNDVVEKPAHVSPVGDELSNTGRSRIGNILKGSVLFLVARDAYNAVAAWISPSYADHRQRAILMGEYGLTERNAWEQVSRSLSVMKGLAEERHLPFLVVSLPRRDQVSGAMPATGYTEKLRAITDGNGIDLLDMLAPLQRGYRQFGKELFIPWDGHNARPANEIIAREIADALIPAGK